MLLSSEAIGQRHARPASSSVTRLCQGFGHSANSWRNAEAKALLFRRSAQIIETATTIPAGRTIAAPPAQC